MKKYFFVLLPVFVLLLGCSDSIGKKVPFITDSGDIDAGMGRVIIAQEELDNRTILPQTPVFVSYLLNFLYQGEGEAGKDNQTATSFPFAVELAPGPWLITVTAYTRIEGVQGITDGIYPAANGSATVTVSAGESVSVTVNLNSGTAIAGKGVLEYDIGLLEEDYSVAGLWVLDMNKNEVATRNLLESASGSIALDAGYYILQVAQVITGKVSSKTELLHIYSGYITRVAESGGKFNIINIVNLPAIAGVTVPATGATQVTAIIETDQYSGTVTWNPGDNPFKYNVVYTATITLTAKDGYTLQWVPANFFTVAGATSVSNAANSGVITAVFPVTVPAVINLSSIGGVTVPATGMTPITTITETTQYNGNVTWNPVVSGTFAGETMYTATITLTAKTGYTLQGVAGNFFTVAGATTVSNVANTGVIVAVFPATVVLVIGDTGPGGGKIFYYSAEGFTMTDTGETCHYLEAAPNDIPTTLTWGTSTSVPGTEAAIGAGRKNTAIILAVESTAPAAKGCKDYRGPNNLSDWFLPSMDELNQIVLNKNVIGNLQTNIYWSSTEEDRYSAWVYHFYFGEQEYYGKINPIYVRAIRAF